MRNYKLFLRQFVGGMEVFPVTRELCWKQHIHHWSFLNRTFSFPLKIFFWPIFEGKNITVVSCILSMLSTKTFYRLYINILSILYSWSQSNSRIMSSTNGLIRRRNGKWWATADILLHISAIDENSLYKCSSQNLSCQEIHEDSFLQNKRTQIMLNIMINA